MGKLHDFVVKHHAFVKRIDIYIEADITGNDALAQLNRDQLLDHKNVKDQTITPPYSPAYAKKKGFKDPNIFVIGGIHASLTIEARAKKYKIFGLSPYAKYFPEKYGEIYGIAPSKYQQAKKITTELLTERYIKECYTQ